MYISRRSIHEEHNSVLPFCDKLGKHHHTALGICIEKMCNAFFSAHLYKTAHPYIEKKHVCQGIIDLDS